ncbi:MAG: ABC transporter permease, partial [Nitrospirae bacterium]
MINITQGPEGKLIISISGIWKLGEGPNSREIIEKIDSYPEIKSIVFDSTALEEWDSGLLSIILKIIRYASKKDIKVDIEGLPNGMRRLIGLSLTSSEKTKEYHKVHEGLLYRSGTRAIAFMMTIKNMLTFIGNISIAFFNLLRGKARLRRSDLLLYIQECGIEALPIVALISILVGLVFAFMGAVQLRMFGAQIFVADLVGLAMTREMGAMMTGVIMAGRIAAGFAASLGTMEVNEEIDAFRTFCIEPIEFLVLPRILALFMMMPLLCLYADFLGILGGAIVGVGMLDISAIQYLNQTKEAVRTMDFSIGIIKSCVFGLLIATVGCLKGMSCERSSEAVGDATKSAVVVSIVYIIVADA